MFVVRPLFILLALLGAYAPFVAAQSDKLELLNATLVARLHFDTEPRRGQMVGAYQVSFRTGSETPISKATILLNPGLEVTKVVGAGGRSLSYNSGYRMVAGANPLELMAADITLTTPLKKGDPRQEIVIHYKGSMQNLSAAGLKGVKETLHPGFAMIRAQGFAYPVFAAADMDSIKMAWNHKPFYQVAFLDVPGNNTVVGNLGVAQKTTTGSLTKFEMKSERPATLMSLAIGPFRYASRGVITIAEDPQYPVPSDLVQAIEDHAAMLEDWFDPAPSGRKVTLVTLPTGFEAATSNQTLFLPPRALDLASGFPTVKEAILELWLTNIDGRPNHWADGFDTILRSLALGAETWGSTQEQTFRATVNALATHDGLKKTPIAEFAVEGLAAAQQPVSGLTFAVLHEILGRDAFLALARGIRAEFSVGYADLAAVGEYLEDNLQKKSARKFVKNWYQKGRIGKDMSKADSFEELVALYR